MQQRLRSFPLLVCQLAFAWLIAARAQAAQFDVAPISMSLSAKASSGTLVITNRAAEPLRFQVTAFAWNQKPDGEMILEPTKDIVFFPAMLVLNPKDSRQIRVGTKLKPGPIERTYRLFVEELPPLSKPDAPNSVRVLTKMGVPVFLEAQAPKAMPTVTTPVLSGRQVTFSVKNTGNAHMRVEKVRLTAKNAAKTVHTDELPGWYVLAGGTRTFAFTLPDSACKEATSLEVKMESDSGSPKASLPKISCSP